jgi:hypothetical protein
VASALPGFYRLEFMNTQTTSIRRHAGPHLGALAIVYTVLFIAGLCAVSAFGMPFGIRAPYWPGPWEPASVIVAYFQSHQTAVLVCLFLQFGALIPLGLFTATVVSRLRFLGVSAAGPYIALFGGLMTVFNGSASAFTTWAMTHSGVTQDTTLTTALYYLSFAFGGPGFSVPMGLLLAGVSVPAGILKLVPKWIATIGLVLAVAGELSWLNLVFPQALFLIPLVRLPGFIWLIAAGFALPDTTARAGNTGTPREALA